jgi:DNA-binding transcriptional ArsR family regulator
MNATLAVKHLAALAHETRLQLFRLLVVAGPQGLTPGLLMDQMPMAAATLSFHLKELSQAGLVACRRQGRFLYYSTDFSAMNGLVSYLTENCCAGQSCAVADEGVCAPVRVAGLPQPSGACDC